MECSQALRPITALEIKWSDNCVQRPEALKGLMKFARKNRLPLVWATTRSQFGKASVDDGELRQWPVAVLAFHYGVNAVRGRLAGFEAQVKGFSE